MSDDVPPIIDDAIRRSPTSPRDGVKHSRPLIFAMLFGVTGALGLPLLWYSPAFSRSEKIWWSIINIAYTAGLVCIAIASVMVIVRALGEL